MPYSLCGLRVLDFFFRDYQFELFAAGLGGLLGETSDESEETEVTAGMSLDMMGVSLRPITFFVGQGGLMSAIWNAPSELMSALQVNS